MSGWNFARVLLVLGAAVLLNAISIPAQAQCELAKLAAADGTEGDEFGWSVAISGDVAVVGARHTDHSGADSGSAYVFRHDGWVWLQEAKLLPADGGARDEFGVSAAIDGDVVIVGACFDEDNRTDSGSAYVYRYDAESSGWVEEAKLLPRDANTDERFGYSVVIRDDLALVGAPRDDARGTRAGAVYVFRYDPQTSVWEQEAKLVAEDGGSWAYLGTSVAISGDAVISGAPGHYVGSIRCGAAYVFRYDHLEERWFQEDRLAASDRAEIDRFGRSVAISGDVAMVGAYSDDDNGTDSGSAYVFRYRDEEEAEYWFEATKLLPDDGAAYDDFGFAVALSGANAVIGARHDDDNGTDSGAAYVFYHDCWTWRQGAKLLASDGVASDEFGFAVAVSADTAVIGAPALGNAVAPGSAYVFHVAAYPGDIDGDNDVDLGHLAKLLSNYAATDSAVRRW